MCGFVLIWFTSLHICALPVPGTVAVFCAFTGFVGIKVLFLFYPSRFSLKREKKGLVLLFVEQTLAVLREMKNKHIFI